MVEARTEATKDGGAQYSDDAKGLSILDAFDKTMGPVNNYTEMGKGAKELTAGAINELTKFSISDGNVCYGSVSESVASHASADKGMNLWASRDDAALLQGGTMAAAAAVSEVLKQSGQSGVDTPSVIALSDQLQEQGWHAVPLDQMKPGDVIIGTDRGGYGGDTGIVGENGSIYAAASNQRGVWKEYPANGSRFSLTNPRWENGGQLTVLRAPESGGGGGGRGGNDYPQTGWQPNEVPSAHGKY